MFKLFFIAWICALYMGSLSSTDETLSDLLSLSFSYIKILIHLFNILIFNFLFSSFFFIHYMSSDGLCYFISWSFQWTIHMGYQICSPQTNLGILSQRIGRCCRFSWWLLAKQIWILTLDLLALILKSILLSFNVLYEF